MKNKLVIIICALFITAIIALNAFAQIGGNVSGIPYYIPHAIMPSVDDSFELGGTSNRWTKIWGKDLDISGAFTLGGTVGTGGIDMNGEIITNIGNAGTDFVASTGALNLAGDLSMLDDKTLYFDTAKTIGMRYDTDHGSTVFMDNTFSSENDYGFYSHSAADALGTWEPYFYFMTNGNTIFGNTTQGNAGDRFLRVGMTDGLRIKSGGAAKEAIILADNIATSDKTFQFPNASGTFITSGNLTDIDNLGTVTIGDGGTTNYVNFAADGELTLHGTARVIRHLRVGAGQWNHGAAAPAAGFEGVFATLDFDAASDDESHYVLIIPSRWDSSADVEFAVDWLYTGAQDNGTVCWGVEYKSIKAGEAVTGAGTTIIKTSAGTHTTGQMVRTTFTTKILASNLENHDTIGIRLYRDVSGDTLAVDAKLLNTHFHFVENSLGDPL